MDFGFSRTLLIISTAVLVFPPVVCEENESRGDSFPFGKRLLDRHVVGFRNHL